MSVVFEKWTGSAWVSVPFTRWSRMISDSGFMRLVLFSTLNGKSLVSGGDQVRVVDGAKIFFRGFLRSGGKVLESGEVRFEADGYGKQISEAKLTINAGSTSNIGLINSTLSGTGISLDSSGAVNRSISFPGFSGMRHRVWDEMTSFYNHRLLFLPNLSARYEVVGAFSSGVSVDTSVDNVRVLSYEEDLSDDLLTRVDVVGKDSGNNIISATSGSGDIYRRFQVGFVRTAAQLQVIADSLLVTEKKDSLKFERFWFEDEVLVNKTMSFVDVPRSINGSFVVVSQEDFYPQRVSVLTLGTDENLNSVRRGHRESSELDEERSTLFEDFLASIVGETANHKHDALDFGHDHDSDVTTSSLMSSSGDNNANSGVGLSVSNNVQISRRVKIPNLGSFPSDMDWAIVTFSLSVGNKGSGDIYVEIVNSSANKVVFNQFVGLLPNGSFTTTVIFTGSDCFGGDNIDAFVLNTSGSGADITMFLSVSAVLRHSHNVDIGRVVDEEADVFDFNRSPGVSGSADGSRAKNLLRED